MKQIIVELDEETIRQLNKVAPARSRKRSEFIRAAIRRALWEQEEQQTRAAYQAEPDGEPAYFDAEVWER